jgi:methionyl-tRNA formyltransferase
MKVLFLGNHTVGVRALRVIHREAELVGVVAHPDDPEDGVCYESVFAEAKRLGVPVVRASGKSPELESFVRSAAPDLIWITDYRYLLPARLLKMAACGTVNLHPSLLPKYRGRAPLNWAILRGETQLGLTAHFVDEGMDTGGIIAQRTFTLAQTQDVGDALEMLYPLYAALTAEVLAAFQAGCVPHRAQDTAQATVFRRRTPEDGLIDWTRPAREVWNLIRAVAAPYPGSFSPWADGAVRIWKATGIVPFASQLDRPAPGAVMQVAGGDGMLVVACGDAGLAVTNFTLENTISAPQVGGRLGEVSVSAAAAGVF